MPIFVSLVFVLSNLARCDCLSYSKIEGNLQERNLQMTDEIQGSRLASTTELGSCLNDWRKIVRLKFGQLRHTKLVSRQIFDAN